jgi:hypothetical protein
MTKNVLNSITCFVLKVLWNLTQVQNQSISKVRSGTVLARQFFNRTFLVDTGPLTFSNVGSRLTVLSSHFFQNESGNLEVHATVPWRSHVFKQYNR